MSTSESKKSSSSKSSKKEHQEDKNDKDMPVAVEEVHTVNNWEGADLGDDQRKQKFLRLMGAKKRKDETPTQRQDSHGSNHDEDVVPEKKHCRSKDEEEKIQRNLEKQFNEGLQSKIAHTHHGGLGFHGETPSEPSSGNWQHESAATKFVAAKTEAESSTDDVKVADQTSDKKEKKSKSKS